MNTSIEVPEKHSLFKWMCLFILSSMTFGSCLLKVHPPPPTQPCTFTISGIFPNCHNPMSSTKSLAYQLDLTVYYFDGSDKHVLDMHGFFSSQTSPSSTITINSKVPIDGYGYAVEATATGTMLPSLSFIMQQAK
jgi:hypothetical protein